MSEIHPETPSRESTTPSASTPGRSRQLAAAGLLAALLASSAWISFPVGTVPLTLQVFVVVLVALLLAPGWAVAAVGVYLLLGALGAPVFAGGHGGLGVLVGPTGGYLFGVLIGVTVGSLVRRRLIRVGAAELLAEGAAALFTLVLIYLLGWLQLALVTGTGLAHAFVVGVVPFAVFDVAKAAVAVVVASALRRAGVMR